MKKLFDFVFGACRSAAFPTKNPVSAALKETLRPSEEYRRAVDAMPADKFGSADPRSDDIGHLVAHIIESNNRSVPIGCGAEPKWKRRKPDAKDKLAASLKASFDFVRRTLKTDD